MKRLKYLLPAALLAGCATGPGLQARMSAYVGSTPKILVQQLGVPDKQISVGGVQYLAYVHHEEDALQDYNYIRLTPGGYYPHPFYNVDLAPAEGPVDCETTFAVQADKITSVKFRGSDCD
jgi:hypothetical protein